MSFGEILSSKLIYEILKERGNDISYVDSRKIIFTKYHNDNEIVDEEKTGIAVSNNLDLIETKIILIPGFIATDSNSEISNLGRGGSDYTASIIANYTNSKKVIFCKKCIFLYLINHIFSIFKQSRYNI